MYGNKAENLAILKEHGFPVPPFYCIPSLQLIKLAEQAVKDELAAEFEGWRLKHHIATAAIRSSAEGEDSETQSYAGQFSSVLAVKPDKEFLDALQLISAAKVDHHYSEKRLTINAIVQEFIAADYSGVSFSLNPATGFPTIIINASRGAGKVTGDDSASWSYTVDRVTKKILDKRILPKHREVLREKTIRNIARVTLEIELLFGSPQDIEWAIKDNKLFILQARPITTINFLQVWDSSNLSESFPGIVSPLTFSIAKRGYELAYRSQAYAAGLSWYDLEKNNHIFDSMLGIFKGRMYYNLINWYRFIGLFPANTKNQQFLDEQIQTMGESVYLPKTHHQFSYTLTFWLRIGKRAIFFEREKNNYWKLFDTKMHEYQYLPHDKTPRSLMTKYTFLEQELLPHMGRAVDNDFFVMLYNGLLLKILPRTPDHKTPSFLSTIKDVISAQQALLLYEIARELQENKEIINYLENKNYDEIDAALSDGIKELIERYQRLYGHRFAEDQKIESENPLLQIEIFYKLLYSYTKLDLPKITKRLEKSSNDLKTQQKQTTKRLSFPKKILFSFLMSRLDHHLRIRENNRLRRGKVFALCREIFKDMGGSLMKSKVLHTPDDIYYLKIDELYGFLYGQLVTDSLQELSSVRRSKYKKYQKIEMPKRFVTTGYPYNEDFRTKPRARGDSQSPKQILQGVVSSPGDVSGEVTILTQPVIPDKPFEILVVSHTDPGWTPLIALAKGVVVEHGGTLSHAAIITRELGIPSIIGVEDATRLLHSGMKVHLNTASGTVDIV